MRIVASDIVETRRSLNVRSSVALRRVIGRVKGMDQVVHAGLDLAARVDAGNRASDSTFHEREQPERPHLHVSSERGPFLAVKNIEVSKAESV